MKNNILGLDLSTSCCGICIMDSNKKLLTLTHVQPRPKPKPIIKLEELFKKADIVKEFLLKYKDIGITDIVIEEPLIQSNNIFTVAILIRFNTLISRIIFDLFNIVPEFISSYDSRKYAFPELMVSRTHRGDGSLIKNPLEPVLFGGYDYKVDKKFIIWELVSKLYPEISWLYTKNNTLKKESFDMSDSVAVCLAHINLHNK